MNQDAMQDLIGSGEVAEMLGIDRRQVTRLVRAGRLVPVSKLPGHTGAYVFPRAAIEALLREETRTAP
jgi:predicted site-specific integrase-resolvase